MKRTRSNKFSMFFPVQDQWEPRFMFSFLKEILEIAWKFFQIVWMDFRHFTNCLEALQFFSMLAP